MNTKLAEVKHHPYLRVELNNNLSLGIHITNTVVKAIRVLNFIRRKKERKGKVPCLPSVKGFSSKLVFNLAKHPHIIIVTGQPLYLAGI